MICIKVTYLNILFGILTIIYELADKLHNYVEKRQIRREIYESLRNTFEEIENICVIELGNLISIFGLIIFLDHETFKMYLPEIIERIDGSLENINNAYVKLFRILGYYRDTLKEILGLKIWYLLEPMVNMVKKREK